MTAFKISLIYVQGCEKRNPTHTYKLGQDFRSENSEIIDRASVELSIEFQIKPR